MCLGAKRTTCLLSEILADREGRAVVLGSSDKRCVIKYTSLYKPTSEHYSRLVLDSDFDKHMTEFQHPATPFKSFKLRVVPI